MQPKNPTPEKNQKSPKTPIFNGIFLLFTLGRIAKAHQQSEGTSKPASISEAGKWKNHATLHL